MINCTELDHVLDLTHDVVVDHPMGIVIAIVSLVLTGVVLLAYGERIIRPAGAVIGGVATLVISYAMLGYTVRLDCEVRVIVAGVVAVLVALAISCILKSGIFLVGSAGLGAVTHLVYDALPTTLTEPTSSFKLMERSGYYYIAMAVAVIGGGILSYTQRKKLMRIMSSAVGGGCLVLATHLVWIQAFDRDVPAVVALVLLLVSTVCGAFLQHYLKNHKKKRRRRRRREEEYEDEDVPIGVPVR
jgi:hypothetical protein